MPQLSPLQPGRTRPRHRPAGPPGRRGRLLGRATPLAALAVAAFAGGVVMGARHVPDDRRIAAAYLAAWARGDHGAMHALLTPAAKDRWPLPRFVGEHERAAGVATLERMARAGRLREVGDGVVEAPVVARTRLFGGVDGSLRLRLADTGDGDRRIAWSREMLFPGLRRGETLRRNITMPPRADLRARNGDPIVTGPDRVAAGPVAAGVAGTVGPIPEDRVEEYEARGYPPDARVGISGLELGLERELAGRFGGLLRAGARVIARAAPQPARAVRSSIDLELQEAAVTALAGRLGGVAAVRPGTGEVLALAGIAASAPQPPGSVFKIVTLAGALEAGVVKPRDSFPVQTATTLEGVELENANGESCGGSLANSFAHSCNSVFAPVGAELGPKRLVATAERFGFNEEPALPGVAASTIPPAEELGDDLGVGSTAIGQGRLLATALHMATVGAAIANRGALVRPVLVRGRKGRRTRATSARAAGIVGRYMRLVVTDGTGVAAAIPGVAVAGKTGTAELRDSTPEEPAPGEEDTAPEDDPSDTDAWFVAYAPAGRPRIAVSVLLVGHGAGGETAAPAARTVLQAALAD